MSGSHTDLLVICVAWARTRHTSQLRTGRPSSDHPGSAPADRDAEGEASRLGLLLWDLRLPRLFLRGCRHLSDAHRAHRAGAMALATRHLFLLGTAPLTVSLFPSGKRDTA